MGKQKLKAYLNNLCKEELMEQVVELYQTSKEVKKYYDFLLNPDHEKIVDEWKVRISKEYFPTRGKRIKARRSIGQKAVRDLEFLGLTPDVIADVRLYAIEVAALYTFQYKKRDIDFFNSFFQQYKKALAYMRQNGILSDFKNRAHEIVKTVKEANWRNCAEFEMLYVETYLKKQQ